MHTLTNTRTHTYIRPLCCLLHIAFSHTESSLKIQGREGGISLLCSGLALASLGGKGKEWGRKVNFGGHKEHLKENVLGPPLPHSGLLERNIMHPQTWEPDTTPSPRPQPTPSHPNHHPTKHKLPPLPRGP